MAVEAVHAAGELGEAGIQVDRVFLAAVVGQPQHLADLVDQQAIGLAAQIDAGVRDGTMRPLAAEQFAVNLIALCVFPFAARPLLEPAFGLHDAAFDRFIEVRKRELPEFFLNALKP